MLKVAAANALEYECHQKSCPKTLHHPVSKSQSERRKHKQQGSNAIETHIWSTELAKVWRFVGCTAISLQKNTILAMLAGPEWVKDRSNIHTETLEKGRHNSYDHRKGCIYHNRDGERKHTVETRLVTCF
jgi:hypothetical protein